jgi:hypothetical protein
MECIPPNRKQSLEEDIALQQQQRRAADTLWRELRGALVAGVREHGRGGQSPIRIDTARNSALRLQNGRRYLDVHASREVVTCVIWLDSDPDARKEVPIGLHPGRVPSFRLDGHPHLAETVAAKLLTTFLDHES